ncbi:MAG TPA: acetyl-CoA carboxylase biotin carboxyl carrier protein subunit [bacterium]|nr:acetyl-CoA carboxylase biotin carboxyl carrier protein subunit [bacterium]
MRDVTVRLGDSAARCTVEGAGPEFTVQGGHGAPHRLRVCVLDPGTLQIDIGGHTRLVRIAHDGTRWWLHFDGQAMECQVTPSPEGCRGSARLVHDDLSAPMPGGITQVLVAPGDAVSMGQPLLIIEAMKMEHVIRAPRAGRIRVVPVRPGDQVEAGAVVVELSPESGREERTE